MSYVSDKIAHLKRAGLVGNGTGAGFGQNGGACPDWLRDEQKAEQKRLASAQRRRDDRASALLSAEAE